MNSVSLFLVIILEASLERLLFLALLTALSELPQLLKVVVELLLLDESRQLWAR